MDNQCAKIGFTFISLPSLLLLMCRFPGSKCMLSCLSSPLLRSNLPSAPIPVPMSFILKLKKKKNHIKDQNINYYCVMFYGKNSCTCSLKVNCPVYCGCGSNQGLSGLLDQRTWFAASSKWWKPVKAKIIVTAHMVQFHMYQIHTV